MASFTVTPLAIESSFDIPLFLALSEEKKMTSDLMQQVSKAWCRFVLFSHVCKLTLGSREYVLVWLESRVEEEIDALWKSEPSLAYTYNAVAQTLCMSKVAVAVPEIGALGCAPVPDFSIDLAEAIETVGISYRKKGEPGLTRTYATLTYYPFQGGCNVCTFQPTCPKLRNKRRQKK